MPSGSRKLLIEGWRSVAHSYALVNQCQLLEFLSRDDLTIAHRDLPYSSPWQPLPGLFSAEEERLLGSLSPPGAAERFDAALRVAFPYDLTVSPQANRTVVFGTSEFLYVPKDCMARRIPLAQAHRQSPAMIVTPSEWSRRGFINAGADADRVVVVPHGVDEKLFAPLSQSQRLKFRRELMWEGFVFLTIGSVAPNKGMDILLKALAEVSRTHPQVRLVVKGLDSIFASGKSFEIAKAGLTPQDRAQIEPRLHYWGGITTQAEMAKLYNLADAYVAPYRAEGFGLPILEAAACGLPVICTGGGSTDDFVRDDFALKIGAKRVSVTRKGESWTQMEPNVEHLIELMVRVVEDREIGIRSRAAGPKFVHANFTWRHAVDKLLPVLFPQL